MASKSGLFDYIGQWLIQQFVLPYRHDQSVFTVLCVCDSHAWMMYSSVCDLGRQVGIDEAVITVSSALAVSVKSQSDACSQVCDECMYTSSSIALCIMTYETR